MKTFYKIYIVIFFVFFQNCMSQNAQKYKTQYNNNVPKLQEIAKEKSKFYNQSFSLFITEMEKKGVKILDYGYDGKIASSPKIYVIRLWFMDHELIDTAQENKYQVPIVTITFKEEIPYEFRALTLKNHGELNTEIKEFLSNRKIEKIVFYGINGLTNQDKTAR